ncbi:MAG: hypothetical protein OHK0045_17670 [Raineya sp.]
MKFWGKLYALLMLFGFLLGFVCVLPFLFLFEYLNKPHWSCYLYRFWAFVFYNISLLPVKNIYLHKFSAHRVYIFCANHTSYLDIATMASLMRGAFAFVGKNSLSKVPLFGYMFRKLHIAVERESKIASAKAFLKMKKTLQAGKSLIIFPEGGIRTQNPPEMTPFKEGAFRLAIETQTPIVPVTLRWAWLVLPDNDKKIASWHVLENIIHPPIETAGMSLADVEKLKEQTYKTIASKL